MVSVTTGDTQPLLTLTLYTDETKTTPLNLTTATSVTWHITRGTVDIAKTATIATDRTTGVTTLQWDGDPTITPSSWHVRAVIVWNDATIETTAASQSLLVQPAA